MKRLLIVGGTGMLAKVTRTLAYAGHQVTVLARNPHRLRDVPCVPLALDYHDTATLRLHLARMEPFDGAVVWTHYTAPEAPSLVASAVRIGGQFVHVLGSATADPTCKDDNHRARFEALGVRYQEVILGFVLNTQGARWLTHSEISDGVLGAIYSDMPYTIVGVVRPWKARPT